MVFMLRGLAALSIAALLGATAAGCGAGLSTDDAKMRCNQEQAARTACFRRRERGKTWTLAVWETIVPRAQP